MTNLKKRLGALILIGGIMAVLAFVLLSPATRSKTRPVRITARNSLNGFVASSRWVVDQDTKGRQVVSEQDRVPNGTLPSSNVAPMTNQLPTSRP